MTTTKTDTATARPCRFCGAEVTAPNPTVDYCRECWFAGTVLEEQPAAAALLLGIRACDGVDHATIAHTGGGCWAIEVATINGRMILVTDGDCDLPFNLSLRTPPEGRRARPWYCGLYPMTDDGIGDEELTHREGKGRRGLLAAIAELATHA